MVNGKKRHRNSRAEQLAQYGLTESLYHVIYTVQAGGCAICGSQPKTRRLAVDHSHKTGYVRGLLCYRCNYALGLLRDDPTIVQAAASYLTRDLVYTARCRHKKHRQSAKGL